VPPGSTTASKSRAESSASRRSLSIRMPREPVDHAAARARRRDRHAGAAQHVDDRDGFDLLEPVREEDESTRRGSHGRASYFGRPIAQARPGFRRNRARASVWKSCAQGDASSSNFLFSAPTLFSSVGATVQLRPVLRRAEARQMAVAPRFADPAAREPRTMRVRASGSFRRYAIDPRSIAKAIDGGARKLRDDGPALAKKLHAQRFRSIDQAGSEIASVGWCRDDGTVPREFVPDDHWFAAGGATLGLVLRIDRKKLPPGALRVRRMEAEAAERKNVGERIAPARRREIVDALEAELTGRLVPSTALHRVLWNLGRGELLLDATADATDAAVRALLRESFDVAPEPLVTATLLARLAPAKPAVRSERGGAGQLHPGRRRRHGRGRELPRPRVPALALAPLRDGGRQARARRRGRRPRGGGRRLRPAARARRRGRRGQGDRARRRARRARPRPRPRCSAASCRCARASCSRAATRPSR
jgi:hypothetical protein